jgi:hypothetical protein
MWGTYIKLNQYINELIYSIQVYLIYTSTKKTILPMPIVIGKLDTQHDQ